MLAENKINVLYTFMNQQQRNVEDYCSLTVKLRIIDRLRVKNKSFLYIVFRDIVFII